MGFHPRFAARYREYRYTVWNGPRSPLRERYAFGVRRQLNIAAMASASRMFSSRVYDTIRDICETTNAEQCQG